MSTRSCIARLVSKPGKAIRFKGVYHHWDGYPDALGSTLFQLRNGHFRGDTAAMLKVLLDDHPAGWSTINGADFNLQPGYLEPSYKADMNEIEQAAYELYNKTPKCYCHGTRSEDPIAITQKNASASGCEYIYAFTDDGKTMFVLSSYSDMGKGERAKAIGMFGRGDPKAKWLAIGQIDLDGIEPTKEQWAEIPIAQTSRELIQEVLAQKTAEQQAKEQEQKDKAEEDKKFAKSELSELIG